MSSRTRGDGGHATTRIRRARFRLRIWWQYRARARIGRIRWLAERLPWTVWCRLCAVDAERVVGEIGRRSRRPLRFVQIGSNNGRVNDPLNATVRARGWTGLLVEPLPRLFEELMANYADVPGLQFENVAVGEAEGEATIYTVSPRPGDPEWVDQIASLDRDVVLGHAYALPDLDDRIVPVTVACVPISTLVGRHDLSEIDLLHMDAEGYDYEIIRRIPLDARWAPRYLIFESKHMGNALYRETAARLRRAGYRVIDLWPDALAYRTAPG